jgi:hypothetical protein
MQQKIAWSKADDRPLTCTFTNDSPVPVNRSFAVNVAITLSNHFIIPSASSTSSTSSATATASSVNQWSLVILPSSHPMVALHRTMLVTSSSSSSPPPPSGSLSPLSPIGDIPPPPMLRAISSDRALSPPMAMAMGISPSMSIFPSGAPSVATLPLVPVPPQQPQLPPVAPPLLITSSSGATPSTNSSSNTLGVTPRLTISAFTGDTPTRGARQPMYDSDILASSQVSNGDASLICLETSIALGTINSGDTRWATLHLLALKEGLLTLPPIFLHHTNTDQYYALGKLHSVFARHSPPHQSS